MRRIKADPECGKPLGGLLKGCRSVRVEGDKRLVYRQGEINGREVVEIIAIDQRRDNEVYDSAEKRVSS
jgi:Txe/YoeB family toxin of Txe-Axe toxin-antitoxin module